MTICFELSGVTGGGGLPDKNSTFAFRVVATASHHKYLNDAPRPHRLSVPSAHCDGSFAACQPAHRLNGLNVAPGRQLHPHCPRRCKPMSEILQVNVGFSALRVHEHGRALLYNLGQASGPLIHSC